MDATRVARVYRVRLIPPSEPMLSNLSFGQRLENALSPGSRAESYGKLWIVGQTDTNANVLSGKLGFERTPGESEVWDEERLDFRENSYRRGLTVQFAVNLETFVLAFQKPSDVTPGGVVKAIIELLNLEGERWEHKPFNTRKTFEDWVDEVEVVTRAKFTVKKPNPHYADAKNLEALMEQSRANVARLEVEADGGVDIESRFLQETRDHVERGYGTAIYTGVYHDESGRSVLTQYDSETGSEQETIELPADSAGEVTSQHLEILAREGGNNDEEDGQ